MKVAFSRSPSVQVLVAVVVLNCLMAGCGRPVESTAQRICVRERFFKVTPEEPFDSEEVGSATTVGKIGLLDEAISIHLYQVEPAETVEQTPKGRVFHTTGKDSQLIFDVELDATRIQEIVVRGKHLGPNVEVFWAGRLQRFSPDRMASAKWDSGGGVVVFAVDRQEAWEGTIKRFRLDPSGVADRMVRIDSIEFISLIPDPERVREASRRPWRITLGPETRSGVPVPFEEPIVWDVEFRPGDTLTFAYGAMGCFGGPVRFSVHAYEGTGSPAPIFSKILEDDRALHESWHEVMVPCPPGRSSTRLEFRVEMEGTHQAAGGILLLAAPAVLSRDSDSGLPNVILISVDTLRPDHLGIYGYERSTSPNLDRWAGERGVVFETVVASAPWTLPSHMSLLSGIGAVRHGINYGIPKTRVPLMSEFLADDGFLTAGTTAGGYLSSQYGFAAGFDRYHAWHGSAGSDGELEEGFEDFMRWLNDHSNTRFFTFFHTYEVHSPYRPRPPYFEQWADPVWRNFKGVVEARVAGYDENAGFIGLNSIGIREGEKDLRPLREGELQLAIDCYDAGIAHTDDYMGRLFHYLDTSGLTENTVVIVTSDHGESLGERGFFDHGRLYDPEILVPLIIAAPGYDGNGLRVSQQVRLVDLVPTILDLVGVKIQADLDGVSLVPFLNGGHTSIPSEAWSYTPKTNHGISVRTSDGRKLIFNNTAWSPAQGREEAYDLKGLSAKERPIEDLEDRSQLRAMILRHLEDRERGIEIEFVNPGNRILSGFFSTEDSQELIVTRIKGVDIPADAVHVVDTRTIAFRVPRESGFMVVAEDLSTTMLHIEGVSGDPVTGSLNVDVDLSTPESRSFVVLDDGDWTVCSKAPEGSRTWIGVRWRNSGPGTPGDRSPDRPEVLEQLRALGYVE